MKVLHGSRARFIIGLAVAGLLALPTVQPLAAHAAGTPSISATVETGRAIVQVSGHGFGSGDRVEVVDTARGAVIGRAYTTAGQIIIRPPKCASSNPCSYFTYVGGFINVTMPPHYLHCDYESAAVRAYDLTNGARSNVVHVQLGLGPC